MASHVIPYRCLKCLNDINQVLPHKYCMLYSFDMNISLLHGQEVLLFLFTIYIEEDWVLRILFLLN